MTAINIRTAEREGARLVVGIAGVSGSGKTYTALQLAYGMANYDASKIGFLDTENRRGSLYADALRNGDGEVQRFLIGDLYAPFSPARYIEAIQAFQQAGVEVLIIDSVTHEWEGPGGCDDIANGGTGRMANWKLAKAQHKKFMTAMLQCDMHVICCIRAREKTDFSDTKNPVKLGVQPVQEKNFMFEMTASLLMWDEGMAQQVLKCPAELRHILGRENGYITPADGAALRAWVDGAKQLDPSVERYRNRLQSVTDNGAEYVRQCWQQTPGKIRAALGDAFRDQLFAAAAAYDEQASQHGASADDINDKILKGGGDV
jgi:hypothetical protein